MLPIISLLTCIVGITSAANTTLNNVRNDSYDKKIGSPLNQNNNVQSTSPLNQNNNVQSTSPLNQNNNVQSTSPLNQNNNVQSTTQPDFTQFGLGLFSGIVTGFFANLGAKYFWNKHISPKIEIQEIVIVGSELGREAQDGEMINPVNVFVNRVRVFNNGKTAALNCKAFLEVGNQLERVGWMLPSDISGYTITLNVKDREYIDLCARTQDNTRTYISNERGLPVFINQIVDIPQPLEGVLRVTSSNAKEAEKKIRIDPNLHDPEDVGRIAQFID
jgi:hypothetical protein